MMMKNRRNQLVQSIGELKRLSDSFDDDSLKTHVYPISFP